MDGARKRVARQTAQIARACWAGSQLTEDGVTKFVAMVLGDDAAPTALPPEMLSAMLRKASKGIAPISRAEALARMKKPA